MKPNFLMLALAGFVGYIIFKKIKNNKPITSAELPVQELTSVAPGMPGMPSGQDFRPTNAGGGRAGML